MDFDLAEEGIREGRAATKLKQKEISKLAG